MIDLIIVFVVGIFVGGLGMHLLSNKTLKVLDKEKNQKEEIYETTIDSLKEEVTSCKNVIKSLNKEIESLKNFNVQLK